MLTADFEHIFLFGFSIPASFWLIFLIFKYLYLLAPLHPVSLLQGPMLKTYYTIDYIMYVCVYIYTYYILYIYDMYIFIIYIYMYIYIYIYIYINILYMYIYTQTYISHKI